ncbi:MAG: IS1595 family transposase [Gammaproteobacteria bacterium]|nr:IS1595 family transposase [Gammaproteobacteria bacterium]
MCDLTAPEFNDEEIARAKVEATRWPNGPVCPHCGGTERNYPIAADAAKKIRAGLYKCGDCDGQFTVTVGTVFEGSKVPLSKWLMAIHLMCASKKGMSSKQLERMLGVTYKTAWFMSHRIREAMREDGPGLLGGGGKTVEVDETFWGNKKPRGQKKGRGYAHKEKILSLVERDGRARSFHVPAVNAKTLRPILKEQIAADTRVMTDDAGQYSGTREPMNAHFQEHGVVKHSIGEYVRGDIHTNTIESYFAIMKRGLVGTFHHVSPKHLKRYLGEFDFRYNYREKVGFTDSERALAALRGIEGKRLMYRESDRCPT